MTARGRKLAGPPWALALALAAALPGRALGEGRALFQGYAPFAAGRDATAQRLPVPAAACASCHGARGEGRQEGGIAAPPLDRASLGSPRLGKPGFASQAAVALAIAEGIGRDGAPLHPAMPRFRLSGEETAALLRYLQRVGTREDMPPGVEAAAVHIGTVLPLSGPGAAVGRAVLAGLRDVFAPLEPAGVHGRPIVLHAADAAEAGAAAAAGRLVREPVYAVVAGLWGAAEAEADALLAARRVPHLASLVVRRASQDSGEWSADLLPSLEAQQRVLAEAVRRCPAPSSRAGCLGLGLAELAGAAGTLPPGRELRVVLPVPAALAAAGPDATWRRLGRAAGRLLVELLARAGPVLHERSLLSLLPGLNGFEPIAGLPVLYTRQRRHAWDPGILAMAGEPSVFSPSLAEESDRAP